ncbi:DUF3237 domain-containing protein [Nitrospirillum sp. BR 11164]|uniref:DUF3237 domain-containing protein n=1 Tax=Nitrospirillum sp. BR 11164 TaxID=3104324 RepID=UPI002AFF987D|nr:DUF3237 domain-containing protein [Nitrospirillum sp. BR 11164]MEA1650881.1 DUF3237 domain-containing protein [Nitrospirillum sp. BR 11164]
MDRRTVLRAAVTAGIAGAIATDRAEAAGPAAPPPTPLSTVPLQLPATEFTYEALVGLDPMTPLGKSPLGERRIIPITGGVFQGPRIRGTVLAGGADRQLSRPDGVLLLNALYELRTDDGAIITVNNRALIDAPPGQTPYAYSVLEFTAPEGPHTWLNRGIFVGTVHGLPAERHAVLIRVYKVV